MANKQLTTKQQRFIEAYNGNATEAARIAGYSPKTACVIGQENLQKPYILDAIRKREKKEKLPYIMNRQERQAFWSGVIRGEIKDNIRGEEFPPQMKDRLKASELLGRSNADFIDRKESLVTGTLTVAQMSDEALQRVIQDEQQ